MFDGRTDEVTYPHTRNGEKYLTKAKHDIMQYIIDCLEH